MANIRKVVSKADFKSFSEFVKGDCHAELCHAVWKEPPSFKYCNTVLHTRVMNLQTLLVRDAARRSLDQGL